MCVATPLLKRPRRTCAVAPSNTQRMAPINYSVSGRHIPSEWRLDLVLHSCETTATNTGGGMLAMWLSSRWQHVRIAWRYSCKMVVGTRHQGSRVTSGARRKPIRPRNHNFTSRARCLTLRAQMYRTAWRCREPPEHIANGSHKSRTELSRRRLRWSVQRRALVHRFLRHCVA